MNSSPTRNSALRIGGALGAGIHEANANFFASAVAERVHTASRSHDRQRSALDKPRQDRRQHHFHDTTTGKPASVTPRLRHRQGSPAS